MPRAILAFRLPQESAEHRLAIDGAKWQSVAWDLDQWLRNKAKHESVRRVEGVRCLPRRRGLDEILGAAP